MVRLGLLPLSPIHTTDAEFATSWRQFRRVVGVNTRVGSRDPYGCVVRSHRRIRRQLSRIHVQTADATRLDSFVGVGSVYWALVLYSSPIVIASL